MLGETYNIGASVSVCVWGVGKGVWVEVGRSGGAGVLASGRRRSAQGGESTPHPSPALQARRRSAVW